MRILQLNNYHYPRGGSDRYFLNLSCALSARGHDVRTFSTKDLRDVHGELRGEIDFDGLSSLGRFKAGDAFRFFYNNEARALTEQLVPDFKPDVAHLHIYYGHITPSVLRPLVNCGIPVVQTLHEYKIVCPAQTMLRDGLFCDSCKNRKYWNAVRHRCNRGSLLRSTISALETVSSEMLGARRSVDRFIAVSHFQKRQLVHMGLDEDKIDVLHNFTQVAENPSVLPGDYFLFVGRIADGKGLEPLLKSYVRYVRQSGGEPLPLRIVGSGPEEGRFQAMTSELGVDHLVEWRGVRVGEELIHEYRHCRALINPSELNETFGLTNIEAMAQGRPVICSDRGAFPEVVRNGTDGSLFSSGSVEELSGALSSMTIEQALAMGHSSYERAQSMFSVERHLDAMEEIYASL